jgi:hypothetical protein
MGMDMDIDINMQACTKTCTGEVTKAAALNIKVKSGAEMATTAARAQASANAWLYE